MTITTSNKNRAEKLIDDLGEQCVYDTTLIRALGGCLDCRAATSAFELYQPGSGNDTSDATYKWKCSYLEEAMGVDELCGADELTSQEKYQLLLDMLVSGDWKEKYEKEHLCGGAFEIVSPESVIDHYTTRRKSANIDPKEFQEICDLDLSIGAKYTHDIRKEKISSILSERNSICE